MEIKIDVSELKNIVLKHFKDNGYIVSENHLDVKIIYEPQNIFSGVSVKIEGIKQNKNE